MLRADDLVWVHDYHLIPLGACLRDAGARQRLGFFLHVPFPHIEVMRTLPVYGELMRALLAYDALGFQTARDLASFQSCVRELWGPGAIALGRRHRGRGQTHARRGDSDRRRRRRRAARSHRSAVAARPCSR